MENYGKARLPFAVPHQGHHVNSRTGFTNHQWPARDVLETEPQIPLADSPLVPRYRTARD